MLAGPNILFLHKMRALADQGPLPPLAVAGVLHACRGQDWIQWQLSIEHLGGLVLGPGPWVIGGPVQIF